MNSILKLLSFSFLFVTCQNGPQVEEKQHPNVILILTDDQGWGDLSLHGNPYLSTPNIDSLALNGAQFENFYVQPVCSPTRAEILTGIYAARLGVTGTSEGRERFDSEATTIADLLQQNNYRTAAFGKWHNGMQPPYHPLNRGFDEFYGFCSGHWGNYFDPVLEKNGALTKGKGFIIDDLTNHGLSFIEQNKDQAFFLYLPYNTPHSPMSVPDRWWQKFKDMDIDSEHPQKAKEKIEHTKAAYALCENIDWNVGRMMKKLRDLNLIENTIVIYLSDNGPNGDRWNGGMKGRKGQTDEGGVKVPFFIQWKNHIPANTKIQAIASATDIFPTITSLANVNDKGIGQKDGISLNWLLRPSRNWGKRRTKNMVINHWKDKTSIRSQRFRLDHENNLYDLKNDLGQLTPVQDSFIPQYENLLAAKEKWKIEVINEIPTKDKRPFTIGDSTLRFTQLPARDAQAHGAIKRSNRWPNCSYFTNWNSANDSITWNVEVRHPGRYKAVAYYACPLNQIGGKLKLQYGAKSVENTIFISNDTKAYGDEFDRFPREESLVKDFIPLELGVIELEKSSGQLSLTAIGLKGGKGIEFRTLQLVRE